MRTRYYIAGLLAAFALAGASAETSGSLAKVPEADAAPITLLVDMGSGQTLLSKDPDRRFVPASITKVMSAFVAFEMIQNGELDERQVFTFSEQAAEDWGRTGSTMFLEAGDRVPVHLLLQGLTSVSANDAAIAIAEGASGSVDAWVERMNRTAAQIGMKNSHFGTPNGWPDEGRTFTTANDLAILARTMISRHPEKYARYFGREGLEYKGIAQANHDPITGTVRGADGIKTGFTNEAGYGFLGSAQRDGTRLIMVVGGMDNPRERARLSREIIEWGCEGFDRKLLFAQGETVARAKVQNGSSTTVPLIPASPIHLAVPQGRSPEASLSLKYDGPVRAPIEKGEQIAELELRVAGMPVSRIPLVAGEDVDRANPLERVWNGIVGWVT